jgi:hypothetical protein
MGKLISVLKRNTVMTKERTNRYKHFLSEGQQNIQLFVGITFMLAASNNVCRFASSATVYRTMMMMMTMMKKKMTMTMMSYCSGHRDNHSYSRTYGPYSSSSAYPNDDHNSNSNANSNYGHGENSNVNSNCDHSENWSKMRGNRGKMYG